MNLKQLKTVIRRLKPEQHRKLYEWLGELMRGGDGSAKYEPLKSQPEKVEERTIDNKTYRLESVKCGKRGCKCADGKLHGPYWYAYWLENGKTKSQYVGKNLPLRTGTLEA